MMKVRLLLSLLCCIIFSFSCATQKRCFEKFNIDTVFVRNVVYRDTVINVHVPRTDTVFEQTTIRDTLIVHSGTTHGQTWVVHDTLNLLVWQSDTTLKVKIDSCIKVINERETQIITIKEKTKLKTYLNYILAFGVIALLIVLIPRVLKKR